MALNRIAPAAALAALLPSGALAADGEPPGWAVQVTPYLWAAGLEGDISPFRRAPTIGIDKSFSDVMDSLNVGGFLNVWARNGRYVASFDIMYVDTTDAKAIGPLPPPIPVPPGTFIDGSIDTTEFMATVLGGYRLIDAPSFSLDALAGVRVWDIENDVTLSALGQSRSYGESFSWVDPVIALRAFAGLSGRTSLQAQADIGGFGAGADFTWSILATVNYSFTGNLSLSAGYKIVDVDYDHGGHVYDTRMDGPVLGVTWRF
jgi:hypothetical protein